MSDRHPHQDTYHSIVLNPSRYLRVYLFLQRLCHQRKRVGWKCDDIGLETIWQLFTTNWLIHFDDNNDDDDDNDNDNICNIYFFGHCCILLGWEERII